MKKIVSTLIVALLVAATLSAAVISSPAATVNLTKNRVITMTQLNAEVEKYKAQGMTNVDPMEVLNVMIGDVLMEQGAERDGYSISDSELEALYLQQKAGVEQQIGGSISMTEFEAIVSNQYESVDAYKAYLKNQYIIQNYVFGAKADIVNDIAEPTEKEIKAWYRQNAASTFAEPEMVRLSIIAKQLTGDQKKDADAKAQLEKALKDIKSGAITFEKAVQLYSEDTSTLATGGNWGYMADSDSTRASMGSEFVEAAMLLEEGDLSEVMVTPSLVVIAKCTDHTNPRILGLEDTIQAFGITVYEYIYQGLGYQNSEIAFYNAYDALLAELHEQAKINIIYKK